MNDTKILRYDTVQWDSRREQLRKAARPARRDNAPRRQLRIPRLRRLATS